MADIVDLSLADSKMNLWVDWEALFSVSGSHYISLTMPVDNENAYHSRHQASGSPGVLLLLKAVVHAGAHFCCHFLPPELSNHLNLHLLTSAVLPSPRTCLISCFLP